ncbi:ChrR family anti-sigma-E factor [Roseobacter sp. HKCCA0434]|uniref:ChrR family anti-sigma-E factor n=1 Tax=Roseobacter sp. HKCCA0434 TaxID=3079297 RepID=UPI002905EE09|nr:ChrR family anti-sigma-E factor [Roseobacter sp. HKCCA0434]
MSDRDQINAGTGAPNLPSDALLAAYASGTASAGMSLLVQTHLAMSAASHDRLSRLDALGGALLRSGHDVAMAEGALAATLDRLEMDDAPSETAADGPLPGPLAAALPSGFDELKWRFRLPGLHECVLDGFDPDEEVSLLRARPGAGMLQHTHNGEEATLILAGEMTDGDTVLRPGDVAEADGDHDHRPRITGDETCYCLIVTRGAMRFTGPLGRALNIFT